MWRLLFLSWLAFAALEAPLFSEPYMNEQAFIDYAQSPDLSEDERYTIELLIEHVRSKFEDDYYSKGWMERSDARNQPGYVPNFQAAHVAPAARELVKTKWISFQKLSSSDRGVKSLAPFRYLTALTGLSLGGNAIEDLAPLQKCKDLKELYLNENRVESFEALLGCPDLEHLEIRGNPASADLSPLARLSKLKHLVIEGAQIDALRKVAELPALTKLELGTEPFGSFEGFPAMPMLRVIWGAEVASLAGIERYPALQNLVSFSGTLDSLEPLRSLSRLTHIHINGCRVKDLTPLARLHALRDIWIDTEASGVAVAQLDLLPALHDVVIKHRGQEVQELDSLRHKLTSWDIEFSSPKPRFTPALRVEVVDQPTFDLYDTQKPYNLTEADDNYELLSSERGWLEEKINEVFAVDFNEDEDYEIPFQWGGARSRTVVLHSEEAVEAFPRLVLRLQEVLSNAKNDWIIYFQSLDEDFVVWVYPDKIVVTPEFEQKVRELIKPK
ncbi:MAG: leucine-rich repeat domain-containing protein [Prosthecobacter sp.]